MNKFFAVVLMTGFGFAGCATPQDDQTSHYGSAAPTSAQTSPTQVAQLDGQPDNEPQQATVYQASESQSVETNEDATTQASEPVQKSRRICKMMATTGSKFKKKVCATRAQWDHQEMVTETSKEWMRNRLRSRPQSGN